MNDQAPTTKQCRTCGQQYPADTINFQKASSSADGLWPECKACANAYQAVWRLGKAVKDAPTDTTPEKAATLLVQLTAASNAWDARRAMGVGLVAKRAPKATVAAGPAVDATAQQAAEHAALDANVAAAGGPASDAGQEVLAAAGASAADARRKADRERKAAARARAAASKPKDGTPGPRSLSNMLRIR